MNTIINTIIFCYSIFSIMLMSITIGPVILVYLKAKKKRYLYFTGLLLCFLCDLIFLHYTDFFYQLSPNIIPNTYVSLPIYKACLFACILYFHLLISFDIIKKEIHKKYIALIIIFIISQLIFAFIPETRLTIWLFYASRELFMLIICAVFYFAYLRLPEDDPSKAYASKYLSLFFCILIMNICILLEDSFVISQQFTFTSTGIIFKERNFTENLYWCLVAGYVLWCSFPHINKMIHVEEYESNQVTNLDKVINSYRFTPREKEIVNLLLQHHDNNEIAETLYISNGTLKTHIHNIYAKAEVTNRMEFIKKMNTIK